MRWRDAVLDALREFALRHTTRVISRQDFLREHLQALVIVTNSQGRTPGQTINRTLQDLRDEGLVQFLSPGQYLLLDSPIPVDAEDFTDEAIDYAIKANKLRIGSVETGNPQVLARRRKGQTRLRALSLDYYSGRCAVCDIDDRALLIASHIVGWADDSEARGDLRNLVCLCRIHDALFENHYWSLTDDLRIVRRASVASRTIKWLLADMHYFRMPTDFPPASDFVQRHRERAQLA